MYWDIGWIATKRALITPDRTALIYEDKPISYKELNDGTNRCAHLFQQKGLKKGDRVAVLLLNCPEFLEVFFAAAKLGLIFVPLNFRLVAPELKYQLNDCGARMLVFHDALIKGFEPIRTEVSVEEDKYLYVQSGVPDAPACPDWAASFHDAVRPLPSAEPTIDDPPAIEDPLAIMYTSGVTGAPKGAVLSHQQTYYKNVQMMMYTDMRETDVYLSQLPLFHSGGLFISATPTLCRGAALIMRQGFDPDKFASDIERHRATIILALTTMWKFVLSTGKLDHVDLGSVRVVLGGGERTPPSMLDDLAAKGLYMQQGLGLTENSAMMLLPRTDLHRKHGSVGLPGFFTHAWIEGTDGKEAAPGEIGEIVAKGPTVMTGYWNLPEKTSEAIVNGVLHTGDLGYRDEDGYFYIVDRAKDMYRSGGENVYPAEIEKVLAGHPRISDVAVIGVPDDTWGETGMAFVIPAKGASVTKDEVLKYLDGKVARYKYPRHVEFIDALPMTASGKVKKVDLKKRFGASLRSEP